MGAPISLDWVAVHPDCWYICLCYLHFAPENPEDGKMYLLVPAHPGCPRQSPESCKMVVCVCVCVKGFVVNYTAVLCQIANVRHIKWFPQHSLCILFWRQIENPDFMNLKIFNIHEFYWIVKMPSEFYWNYNSSQNHNHKNIQQWQVRVISLLFVVRIKNSPLFHAT